MENELNEIEARVLGCLLEKEMTTPEYYPLSLNALTNACNQKSNREPLMALDEESVTRALDGLRFKQLVVVAAEGGRVPKYRHLLVEKLRLLTPELALLCELLLRGPQTLGELRTRTERMHSFDDLAAVEETLKELIEREQPLVARLARQPGRKEARFAQLFTGEPVPGNGEPVPSPGADRLPSPEELERMVRLEEQVAGLRDEVDALRRMMEEFKRQFE